MSQKSAKRQRQAARALQRETLEQFALACMKALRTMLAQDLKRLRQQFPGHPRPCDTCAFRASTDSWEGMQPTVMLLLAAFLSGAPFYCHSDPATGEPFPDVDGEYGVLQAMERGAGVNFCAAWSALAGRTREDVLGVIADAAAGHPVPRPLAPALVERLMGLVGVVSRE